LSDEFFVDVKWLTDINLSVCHTRTHTHTSAASFDFYITGYTRGVLVISMV